MRAPELRFGQNIGPAPVNVALPAQPLSFSSAIGSFTGGPGFSAPSVPSMSKTPTTVGDLGVSTQASTLGDLGQGASLFNSDGGIAMAPAADAAGAAAGGFWGKDGFNIGDVGSIAKVIGGFGNLWMGMQANKLAKDTLNFQKSSFNENLKNQIASFNLALEDRMNARYAQKNRSPDEAQAAIDRHKL